MDETAKSNCRREVEFARNVSQGTLNDHITVCHPEFPRAWTKTPIRGRIDSSSSTKDAHVSKLPQGSCLWLPPGFVGPSMGVLCWPVEDEVTSVSPGADAIEAAASRSSDLVLLDLMLQGHYDGFDVCRHLRRDPTTRDIPVIVITALDDEDSRAKAAAAGATAYHTKPFTSGALLEEIERTQKTG